MDGLLQVCEVQHIRTKWCVSLACLIYYEFRNHWSYTSFVPIQVQKGTHVLTRRQVKIWNAKTSCHKSYDLNIMKIFKYDTIDFASWHFVIFPSLIVISHILLWKSDTFLGKFALHSCTNHVFKESHSSTPNSEHC